MQNTVWVTSGNACKERDICSDQNWSLWGFVVLFGKDIEQHVNVLELNPAP